MDETEGTKVSELVEATEVDSEDIAMIVQGNVNKKIKITNLLKETRALVITDEEIPANTDYTIPIPYLPGTLKIYCEGSKLIYDEEYIERNSSSGKSTTIQFKDWNVPENTKLEFIVRK